MEHPLCKFCHPPRRHKLGEAHIFPASKLVTLDGQPFVDAGPIEKSPKLAPEDKAAILAPLPQKNPIAARSGTEDKAGPRALSPRLKAELAVLEAMPDEQIDTSDIPETLDWSGCPHCAARRAKRAATIRKNREKKRG